MPPSKPTSAAAGSQALQKASARILPFFFVLYVVSYMDRANVGFAKLPMLADLHFSEAVFGAGAGIFFLGYFLLEIPGAIIVERWSARLWISRIMITWGIFAVLVGFVRTPMQFYGARFALGLAEAGFFPGLIVYMTHWFPVEDRARAMAGFIMAVPVSFAVGAPLSALMMGTHWLGLPGWRWLFILQGLPAIVCGIVTPFYLSDHPRDAQWLDPADREWLTAEIEREKQLKRAHGHVTILEAFRQRNVILLAVILCIIVISSYGCLFWLSTTIQKASGFSDAAATTISAVPFLFAVFGVWYCGRSSDRTRERKFHTAVPLAMAGLFFGLTTIPNQPFPLLMLWLSLTGLVLWAWAPSYWVLPSLTLGDSAAAASIGLINSIGNLGGFIGPSVVGAVLTHHHSYSFAAVFLSLGFLVAAGLTLLLRL